MFKVTTAKTYRAIAAKRFGLTRRSRRARGAAMIEFCLAVPFLLFILVLIFFFGSALKTQQDVKYTARHFAWRDAQSVSQMLGPQEPAGTREALVDRLGGRSEKLARTLFMERFPRGVDGTYIGGVASRLELFDKFNKTIQAVHVREGVPWMRDQARPEDEIAVQFLGDLDSKISGLGALGDAIEELYLARW